MRKVNLVLSRKPITIYPAARYWYTITTKSGRHLHSFCAQRFERYTGIKLKPGEKRRIKSIKIVLEKP